MKTCKTCVDYDSTNPNFALNTGWCKYWARYALGKSKLRCHQPKKARKK